MRWNTLFIILVFIFACQRKSPANTTTTGIPVCVQKKIDSLKLLPVFNPPATVEEYDYNGKKVYVFSADCCDFFATAFDADCNYICAPSGGFTGKGDGKCKDFSESAKMVRVVWKDDRVKWKKR